MAFTSSVADEPEKSQYIIGFPKGLNTVQDPSLVDDKNLIIAKNVQLAIDGVERRYGTDRVYNQASATKTYGAAAFYKKTSGVRQFVRIANGHLQYASGTAQTWTEVSSTAYTSAITTFVQARDKLFIYNGTDKLSYWDGATITTYTAITTPTGLTVTPTFQDTQAVSTITRSGSTATVTTSASHGFKTGDSVTISGAAQTEYNVTAVVTLTSPTTFTYTVSGTPATPATGTILLVSAGTSAYSYRVSAFNSTGETLACTSVAISNGATALSTTKYNTLAWSTVSGATGYNIYGRHATGYAEVYLSTVYGVLTYNDTGSDTEVTSKLPVDANNTGGVIGKVGCFAGGRQFVAGVTEGSTYYPTRLYYSGTVQYVDAFVGGQFGGGWVDVYANDGGEIVDIRPYQNGVVVWKTNGIFKFYFTSTGLPALDEITRSHGGVSSRGSQAIDNDIVYVAQKENRISVMTLGQQQNYVGTQLRTNELSIYISTDLQNVNRSYLNNVASFYYGNRFGFAFSSQGNTENDRGYLIDTRFGGFVMWDGLPMNCVQYTIYDDGSTVHLYGGSNMDGYMIELFKDARDDDGVAFTSVIGTKQYNANMFDIEKIWRNPTLWFKYIAGGTISAEVWTDGTVQTGSAILGGSGSAVGAGTELPGFMLPGTMLSQYTAITHGADVPQELSLLTTARSINFYLIDTAVDSNWLFMGIHLLYSPLEGKPLPQANRVEIS